MSKSTVEASSASSVTVRVHRYPEALRRQAVELFQESLPEHKTRQAAAKRVAELLGVRCSDTVLAWVKQAEVDGGVRPGVTSDMAAENKRLRREVAELKRANAILKAASVFFAAELDRPQSK